MDISIPFNLIDVLIVIIAVISGVMASLRGLIREVFGLTGWVLAIIGANLLSEVTTEQLAEYIASDDLRTLLGWALPFIIISIIWYILSNILSPPLRRFTLNMLDRPLGFIYGLARGIVIAALIYMGALFAVEKEDALPSMVQKATLIDVMRSTTIFLANLTPESIRDEIVEKIPETIIDPDAPLESVIPEDAISTSDESNSPTASSSKTGSLLQDELGDFPTITDGD
jgi:membrane protein required for colicin V production